MRLAEGIFFKPMLATLTDTLLTDEQFIYEPKYDGIRAIVDVPTNRGVRIWSRLGNEKTAHFPEIARALEKLGRKLKASVVLDGEIVALDERGDPRRFSTTKGCLRLPNPSRTPPFAFRGGWPQPKSFLCGSQG